MALHLQSSVVGQQRQPAVASGLESPSAVFRRVLPSREERCCRQQQQQQQLGFVSGSRSWPAAAASRVVELEEHVGWRKREVWGDVTDPMLLLERCEVSEAVEALDGLVQQGCDITTSLLFRVLKRCIAARDLASGRRLHSLAVRSGFESDAFLATHIIGMYAGHGKLEEAVGVFSKVPAATAHMWSSIILAHAHNGQPAQAVCLYRRMRDSGAKPDNHIFVAVLKACAAAGDLEAGKDVHGHILASSVRPNTFVANSLLHMYAKCGSLDDARNVFDSLPTGSRSKVTWTAMIAAYVQQGLGREALALYAQGVQQQGEAGLLADSVSFVCLLKACAAVGASALHQGKQLHAQVRERGLEWDVSVGSSLVNMYAKCSSLEDARKVFDALPSRDVVTWTAMLSGYAQHGLGHEALALYRTMSPPANPVTFVCLLQACASAGELLQGQQLHAQFCGTGLEGDLSVGNALVDMYAKCGSLDDARRVFDGLPAKDIVTWNTMMAGYSQQGFGGEALALYQFMVEEGMCAPNRVSYMCLLHACANAGAVQQAKELHAHIREQGLEGDVFIGSGLVDMYAKCGSLEDARQVFDMLPNRDVVTWNALLNGCAQHSDGERAVQYFEEMCQQGCPPNDTTYICLLVACSHAGLVLQGKQYFSSMVEKHGVVPTASHYSCMIDLLGRSGHLDEAESMLQSMPGGEDVVGWTSLLTACKGHGDVERGRRCFDRVVELEPESASAYVLLGSIYASAGRWAEADRIEALRKAAGAWKKPAKACIEVHNKVHEFTVGEERADISAKARSVNSRLKEEGGHVPRTDLVLKAVSEQEKEDTLCGHAEKLALAYGLLNTPHGTPLLVNKNLRMCNDCHSSTKVMSRLEQRHIIVRDAHRVHRFSDGVCSCGDRH